ncbi:MAG: HAMP domain-containing histidine kinase, partial [Oscillospiraceae bacterium]|nr:HAMP domain-containing histidine kinase [Oscillospiraceae bacterium]
MYLYDAVPMGEKVDVYYMEIGFADGSSWGVENEESSIGYLRKSPNGAVEMLATVDLGDVDLSAYPVEVLFFDREHNCLYQASNPNGVMESAEYRRGVGESFLMRTPQEIAGTAVLPTEPDIEKLVPETTEPIPEEPAATEPEGQHTSYYSNSRQQRMDVVYTMESAEGYTVHVMLAENPLQYDGDWMLVRLLYALRDYLPVMLIGGLILFAVTAVYLCCAAARKQKTDEVRPGGLNCIPLDLYAALVVGGEALLYLIAYEALPELIHFNATLTALVGAVLAYAGSLLIVGFCFACAAQFKTKGGYWWRHSLCGLCLGLAEKLIRWGFRMCKKLFPGLWELVKAIVGFALTVLGKIFAWLEKIGKSLGKKLNRCYSLLPMTWQWVLAGSGLVLLIFLATESRRAMLLSILISFALILYGAHCFGTLLEGVKKMRKGNLEEKVDDQLMTGSFKEFAGELNGLADVAVVAAQKQLKSERMKTELITNVSHDIKTPLTSIINYVYLLQKPHTEEEQEKYLEVLDRQSQRLKKLVDDLMEMSKASTGNLAVEIGRLDAAEAVNQALGEFADKLEKAELYPVFRQPEQPVYMLADGRLVWRVMSNLLSNAVKYALPGTRLYVDLHRLENKVILSLKNISREELNIQAEELLERFVRGDASRNTEGSGLGLNIA